MTSLTRALRLPRRDLAKIVALGVAQALTLVGLVLLVRRVIDVLVATPGELATVLRLVGLLAALMLANAGLRAAEFSVSERMGYEVVRKLRIAMYEHLGGMAPRQIQHRSRGGLLLRFTGDLTMFRTWISRGIARGIVSGLVVLGGVLTLFVLDPWIGMVLVAVLSAGTALSLSMGERLRKTTKWVRRKRSLLTSNVDEQVAALAVVQVFGRSGGEYARLARQNDSLTRTLFREASIRGRLRGVSSGTAWLAVAGILAVGAIEISRGQITVGLIVAALTAVRQLTGPTRNLGLAHDYWQRAKISRGKILDFMASSSRHLGERQLARLRIRKGRIEFRDVSVRGALDGVNLTAEAGEIVAIVGPVGAGKSTLLALVARLLEPDVGEVLLDDQPLADCTLRSTIRRIGMVSPDLPLMRGSVRRNLTYRDRKASEEEVRRVMMACSLDELIAELDGGMDAWVTEGGGNLSAGQRQRLALGRALLGNPRILLLDEPTSNLDRATRNVYHRVLTRHHGTVLWVTHDPDEMSLADRVWVLEGGRVGGVLHPDEYGEQLSRERRGWHATIS